jgi:hypothetical protein
MLCWNRMSSVVATLLLLSGCVWLFRETHVIAQSVLVDAVFDDAGKMIADGRQIFRFDTAESSAMSQHDAGIFTWSFRTHHVHCKLAMRNRGVVDAALHDHTLSTNRLVLSTRARVGSGPAAAEAPSS